MTRFVCENFPWQQLSILDDKNSIFILVWRRIFHMEILFLALERKKREEKKQQKEEEENK